MTQDVLKSMGFAVETPKGGDALVTSREGKRLEPTPEQQAVAEHEGTPALVVAGAGTGKTATVCMRVAKLVANGAQPESIMMLTFTRAAAEEMRDRIASALGPEVAQRVVAGTFHSVATRQLRERGARAGWNEPRRDFEVLGTGEVEDVIGLVRGGIDKTWGEALVRQMDPPGNAMMGRIRSDMMNRDVTMEMATLNVMGKKAPTHPRVLDYMRDVFDAFDSYRANNAQMTYDDILVAWLDLLEREPVCCSAIAHVIVDEAQDMNTQQHRLLRAIAHNMQGNDVMVVGDAAQSIYGWRGSDVHAFDRFCDEWDQARELRLSANFRSVPAVTDTANEVLKGADVRSVTEIVPTRKSSEMAHVVPCANAEAQAELALRVAREAHAQGRTCAVMSRASYVTRSLEMNLRKNDISCEVRGGTPFCELTHVRDVLAVIRMSDGTETEWSMARLLRGYENIGPVIAHRVVESGVPECLTNNAYTRMRGKYADAVRHACADLSSIRARLLGMPWPQVMEAACDEVLRHLRSEGERIANKKADTHARRDALDALDEKMGTVTNDFETLCSLARTVSSSHEFSDTFKLETPAPEGDHTVTLTTIHSAKGLEWDVVVVMGCDDSTFPGNGGDPEEMRRLLYVAVTRARDELWCLWPMTVRDAQTHVSPYLAGALALPTVTTSCALHANATVDEADWLDMLE